MRAGLPARPRETPSPEALIRAPPVNGRVEREAAYRSLYACCASLPTTSRASLLALQRDVLATKASREAGARVFCAWPRAMAMWQTSVLDWHWPVAIRRP